MCLRERAEGAAPPPDAPAPVAPAPGATAPVFAPVPVPVTQVQPAAPAAEAVPDSAPTAPTVSNAPEPPQLSIRIPPAALALPAGAIAMYLLLAFRPPLPEEHTRAPRATAVAEISGDEIERLAREDDAARTDGVSVGEAEAASASPADPLLTAAKIVQLERTREQAQKLDAARSQVKVVLYTSERCSRCVEARTHLIAQGIRPIERDVDKDARARARHRALSRKGGLPTLEIDGKILIGFQKERVQKALDRAATVRLQRKR